MSQDVKMDPGTPTDPSLINSHLHAGYSNGAAHSTTNGLGGHSSPVSRVHPVLPHGYGAATPAQNEAHIDPELRSHEPTSNTIYPPPPPNMMPSAVSQPSEQAIAMTGPAGHASMGYAEAGDIGPDGRKAKRELSQSKRAAQNRAAQRAFRQRKEGYIKKLEQEVKDFKEMDTTYKAVQAENENLRIYVIDLQSRLLDLQGNYPPPPANINLAHPRAVAMPPPGQQPSQGAAAASAASSLEVVAQAVAGLARENHRDGRGFKPEDNARDVDEIGRQLQGEAPNGLAAATM